MDIMNQIAQSSKKTVEELAKQMYINFRKSAGVSEDAAALELENAQLKKQVDAGKSDAQGDKDSADTQERARKEFAEFRQLHPDVALTDALVAKLKPDVRKGMSLANAYQKMVNEQKAAELAEQERKAKAEAQNKKNRAAAPGSQQDSGGRRQKSGFDDFFAQFK
jgi:regulator of replication initiation timing